MSPLSSSRFQIITILFNVLVFAALVSQVLGIVYIFGWWKTMPKWLRITSGILQIILIIIILSKILNPDFC